MICCSTVLLVFCKDFPEITFLFQKLPYYIRYIRLFIAKKSCVDTLKRPISDNLKRFKIYSYVPAMFLSLFLLSPLNLKSTLLVHLCILLYINH